MGQTARREINRTDSIRHESTTAGSAPVAAIALATLLLFAAVLSARPPQQEALQPQQQQQSQPQTQQPPQAQQAEASALQRFSIEGGVSIELGPHWKAAGAGTAPPPGGLGPYAPPFHFNQILFLTNPQQFTVLQLATSDNALIGHDAYWLDTQMHSLNGSGMSLPDYLFYLFLPPSHSCMDDVLAKLTAASRAPQRDDHEFSQSELQVTFACEFSPTLPDFYSQQLSTGITFRQALNGPRAYGDFKNLDLPPMEQVDFSGMTFFVFEALSREQISENAAHNFHLPVEMQGLHADYFWAVGATSPYPFTADPARKNTPIVHLAYAGAGTNKRADFLRILQRVRTQ